MKKVIYPAIVAADNCFKRCDMKKVIYPAIVAYAKQVGYVKQTLAIGTK